MPPLDVSTERQRPGQVGGRLGVRHRQRRAQHSKGILHRYIIGGTPPSVYALLYTEGVSGGGSSRVACSVSQATGCLRLKACSAPRGGDFAALPSWLSPWFFPMSAASAAKLCAKFPEFRFARGACAIRSRCSAEFFCVACRTPFLNRFPLDESGRCPLCRLGLTGFDAVYSYGSYEGSLRKLIHLFKYDKIYSPGAAAGGFSGACAAARRALRRDRADAAALAAAVGARLQSVRAAGARDREEVERAAAASGPPRESDRSASGIDQRQASHQRRRCVRC